MTRIKQVRELCGWTQVELAGKLCIKQPTLAQLENFTENPSRRVLDGLAELTDFLPDYFSKPITVDFPMGSLLFRAHASMTNRHRVEAYRHAQLLHEIWSEIAERVNELPVRIPQLKEDPVLAARLTRAQLGISPDTPIAHVLNTVEKAGVILLCIPVNLEKRDAFSLWAGSPVRKPVIAISSGRPGDRVNWSVAHELGHLILHNPIWGSTKDLEDQADQFAAEFLLPEYAMQNEFRQPVTLQSVAQLKIRWRVSMQALIRRAHDVGMLTDRAYRYLFEQMAWRGWRLREPSDVAIPAERPQGLLEMCELIYGKPVNVQKLSRDSLVGATRLKQILNAHNPSKPSDPTEKNGKIVTLSLRKLG
jgi:Zn-dependent peptidase ImmA (M78 family)/DNA-binding XRE family transcriptional regulator